MFLSVGKRIPLFFSSFLLGPPKGEGAVSLVGQRSGHLLDQSFPWEGSLCAKGQRPPTAQPSCPFSLI